MKNRHNLRPPPPPRRIAGLPPYVRLGPFGGAIADRYPRRTVLLVGDLLRLALMLVFAAVVARDGPVALVIALAALSSAAGSAEQPASLALLPRLVGERRLGPANALLHTVQDLGVVVGPALGAVLLAVLRLRRLSWPTLGTLRGLRGAPSRRFRASGHRARRIAATPQGCSPACARRAARRS